MSLLDYVVIHSIPVLFEVAIVDQRIYIFASRGGQCSLVPALPIAEVVSHRREVNVVLNRGENLDTCDPITSTGERINRKGLEKVNHEQQLHFHGTRNKENKKNRKKKDESPTGSHNKSSSLSLSLEDSGGHRKADSFNLGIGFGLIYLFNATKNELNKIVEIHREMEILLQNSKIEFQRQRRIFRSRLSNSRPKCDSDCVDDSTDLEESEITCCSLHDRYKIKGNTKTNFEMNQLEAELEVELERLQFPIDSPVMLKYPTHRNAEIMVDQSLSEESFSTSCGEVYDPNSYVTEIENCGVPPQELNRRLHELIQTRQEERIKELESALESTIQKLDDKEKEVCWWRDTAKVISQHVPSRHHLLS